MASAKNVDHFKDKIWYKLQMKEMTGALYANDLLEHCFFIIRLMCIALVSSSVKCASEKNQTRGIVRDK